MKRRLLSLIFAICCIIPSAFILSACGDSEKQAEPVSISASYLGAEGEYDDELKTIVATYGDYIEFDETKFSVYVHFDDGSKQLVNFDLTGEEGYSISYNFDNSLDQIEAGTYQITISYKEFENITFNYVVAERVIAKPVVNIPSMVYSGSVQSVSSYIEMVGDYYELDNQLSDGLEQTDAGRYKLVYTITDECTVWEDGSKTNLEFFWTIDKLTVLAPTVASARLNYQDEMVEGVYQGVEQTLVVDWTESNAELFELDADSDKINQTDADSYITRYNLKDSKNYKLSSSEEPFIEFAWEIVPKLVEKPSVGNTEFTFIMSYDFDARDYRGELQSPEITYPTDQEILFEIDNNSDSISQRNAGNFESILKLKDSQNYCFADNSTSLTIDWVINIREVVRPTMTKTEYTYKDVYYTPEDDGVDERGYYPVNIVAEFKDSSIYVQYENDEVQTVGNFKAKVSLRDTVNCKFIDFEGTEYEIDYVVKPKVIRKPYLRTEVTQFEYTGSTIKPDIFVYEKNYFNITNNTGARVGNDYYIKYVLKEKYEGLYVFEDGTMEDVYFYYDIIKKPLDMTGTRLEIQPVTIGEEEVMPRYISHKHKWQPVGIVCIDGVEKSYPVSINNILTYPSGLENLTEEQKIEYNETAGCSAGWYVSEYTVDYYEDGYELYEIVDGEKVPFTPKTLVWEVEPAVIDFRELWWVYDGRAYDNVARDVPVLTEENITGNYINDETVLETSFEFYYEHYNEGSRIYTKTVTDKGNYSSKLSNLKYKYSYWELYSWEHYEESVFNNSNFKIIDYDFLQEFEWYITDMDSYYSACHIDWCTEEVIKYGELVNVKPITEDIDMQIADCKITNLDTGDTFSTYYLEHYAFSVGRYSVEILTISINNFPHEKDDYRIYFDDRIYYFEVIPADIDVSGIKLKTTYQTYTGEDLTFELDESTIPNTVEVVSITNNVNTKVGSYEAIVKLAPKDKTNYNPIPDVVLSYQINKIAIVGNNIKFEGDKVYSYDGQEHFLTLINVPEHVTVSQYKIYNNGELLPEGVGMKNVGSYTVCAYIDYDKEIYNFYTNFFQYDLYGHFRATVTINKAKIDVSEITWGSPVIIEYDGQVHKPVKINVPDVITPKYSYSVRTNSLNDNFIDRGAYRAEVVYYIEGIPYNQNENYELTGDWSPLYFDYTITKAKISLEDVAWNMELGGQLIYNGEKYKPTLLNVPELAEVSYQYLDSEGNRVDEITNAGAYTITAILTCDDNHLIENPEWTATLEIVPAEISVKDVTWNMELGVQLTYDREKHTPKLINIPDGVEVDYEYLDANSNSVDEIINAGQYSITATLTCDSNHMIATSQYTGSLEILQAVIDISLTEWNFLYEDYEYDGEEHKAVLENIPEFLEISYTYTFNGGEVTNFVDAGNYAVSVELVYDSVNYTLYDSGYLYTNISWTIQAMTLDLTGVTWDYDPDQPFVYDGTVKTVNILNVPEGIDWEYEYYQYGDIKHYQNQKTNADTYYTRVTLSKKNYNTEVLVLKWVIEKAEIPAELFKLQQDTFKFNNKEQEVTLSYRHSTAQYEVISGTKATDAGSYKAVFKLDPYIMNDFSGYNDDNYKETIIELDWTIEQLEISLKGWEWSINGFDIYDDYVDYYYDGTSLLLPTIEKYPNGTLASYTPVEFILTNSKGEVIENMVNIGVYTYTIKLTGYKNYYFTDFNHSLSITLEVKKYQLYSGDFTAYAKLPDGSTTYLSSYFSEGPYEGDLCYACDREFFTWEFRTGYDVEFNVEVLSGTISPTSYGDQYYKVRITTIESEVYDSMTCVIEASYKLCYSPVRTKDAFALVFITNSDGNRQQLNNSKLFEIETIESGVTIDFKYFFDSYGERLVDRFYINGTRINTNNKTYVVTDSMDTLEIVAKDSSGNVIKSNTITVTK